MKKIKGCFIVMLLMIIIALPLLADAGTDNWVDLSPGYAREANKNIWEVVPGIVQDENVHYYTSHNDDWNIEADKGAHFTVFAATEILIDWSLTELMGLDYRIPGTNINLWKFVGPAILTPLAFITENNFGVKNTKDSQYDLYGLAFGFAVRLL